MEATVAVEDSSSTCSLGGSVARSFANNFHVLLVRSSMAQGKLKAGAEVVLKASLNDSRRGDGTDQEAR